MNSLPDMDWESARVFLAVARAGSMLAGAKLLRLSQPSVTRVIQGLEEAAGQRLFVRHARGIRLTQLGESLRVLAERAEVELANFQRVAQALPQVEGVLRIATTEFIGVEVLAPRLHELREAYPRLRFELVLQNSASDLLRGDADIAVRLFRPREGALVTKLVTRLELGFYAAERYIERRGAPHTLDDIGGHDLIGYDPRGPMASSVTQLDARLAPSAFALGTDCLSAHVALARHGFGIAGMQVGFAQRYAELRRVLLGVALPEVEVWLVTHEDLRASGRVRAGVDWLERVLVEYAGRRATD
jgi:DNA-binding transcriptional LysR family regulator